MGRGGGCFRTGRGGGAGLFPIVASVIEPFKFSGGLLIVFCFGNSGLRTGTCGVGRGVGRGGSRGGSPGILPM